MDNQDAVRMDHDVAFTDLEVCAVCMVTPVVAPVAQSSGVDCCPVSCFETRARILFHVFTRYKKTGTATAGSVASSRSCIT